MVEAVVTLKPKSEWREGMTSAKLIQEMDSTLRFPGMPNIFWMPIQTRTEMLATGIRSALGVKVFGPDLEVIERTAIDIERALQEDERTAPYTRSAFAERTTGGYFLDFDIRRDAAARFGLNVADIETTLVAAVGGMPVSETIEGRERYTILLRYAREYRDNLDALERVLIPTPTGAQIPITQVADLTFRTGPPMIRSEGGQLVGFVFVDVRDSIGIADYVNLSPRRRPRSRRPRGVRARYAWRSACPARKVYRRRRPIQARRARRSGRDSAPSHHAYNSPRPLHSPPETQRAAAEYSRRSSRRAR